jgi:hypothetical protein
MPATTPRPLDSVTGRFRMLALRRHAYYLELLQSGRWRHYFTEREMAERLRDVVASTKVWNSLAVDAEARLAPALQTRSAA